MNTILERVRFIFGRQFLYLAFCIIFVVMSCEVHGNCDSTVRRESDRGLCAMVSRGDGTMDTECVSLWPNGCQ